MTHNESATKKDLNPYSEAYKAFFDIFTSFISNHCKTDECYHFEDIEYFDGYFVFDMGENSVVNFHVRECPGWLFGIWWKVVDEDVSRGYTTLTVDCKFFSAYERIIDKFKPSACTLNVSTELKVRKDDSKPHGYDFINPTIKWLQLIQFISKEPCLAFCRDQYWLDYNFQHLSREEAKQKFDAEIATLDKEERVTSTLDSELLEFVNQTILPQFKGGYIEDRGKSWHPRYQLCAPESSISFRVKRPGIYHIHPFISIDSYDKFEDLLVELDQRANDEDVCWYAPIDMVVQIYDDSEEKDGSTKSN